MDEPAQTARWGRDELLFLLSVAATLAGLCVTVVALMKTLSASNPSATIVDDMFALCAVLFLIDSYLIFWAFSTRRSGLASRLVKAFETIFLSALTLMTLAALIMLYTVW